MSKSETVLAFEAAMKENKELREKFEAAQERMVKNKEVSNAGDLMVKAAAEVGFTLTVAEVERAVAAQQELNDEELMHISGGTFNTKPMEDDHFCWDYYYCYFFLNHDEDGEEDRACLWDYLTVFEDIGIAVGEAVLPYL